MTEIPPPPPPKPPDDPAVTLRTVFRTWWPLAASWLLMGLELPAVSAIIARLEDPEVQLAAYGGVVFPLAILIEGPIIMLLAASTALCRDLASYRRVHRFMMASGLALTVVHAAVAFTPIFDWIVRDIIEAPSEIHEPARRGMQVMLLWTWCIGYRRFQQGVLIRFGHAGAVGKGTIVRLLGTGTVLAFGYRNAGFDGAVVGAAAVSTGVLLEAVYAGLRVQPVLRDQVRHARLPGDPMGVRRFLAFYLPLALTPVLTITAQPVVASALSRLPNPVESLAVWPALYGLVFLVRCLGMAYNEVVVALLGRPGAFDALRRFTALLMVTTTAALFLTASTPLGHFWFETVVSLRPGLAELARGGLLLAWVIPALSALQSWYQGRLVHVHRTRGITESVVVLLVALVAVLFAGVVYGRIEGVYVGVAGYLAGMGANVLWLRYRVRGAERVPTSAEAAAPTADAGGAAPDSRSPT